jgi:hypothetical protein
VDFEAGMARTVEWFEQKYHNGRLSLAAAV